MRLRLPLRLLLALGALAGGGGLLYHVTTSYLAARALMRAQGAVGWGRFDEALAHSERARALTPGDARVWRETGALRELVYGWRGAPEAAAGAVAAYARAAKLNPQDATLYSDLGRAWAAQGRVDEARAAFEAALARDPHNVAYLYALGRLLEDAGRAEAASFYERALAVREDARVNARLEALGRP